MVREHALQKLVKLPRCVHHGLSSGHGLPWPVFVHCWAAAKETIVEKMTMRPKILLAIVAFVMRGGLLAI